MPDPPSPAPDTCWLYLLRHAATANNLARPPRLQGRRLDAELSDEGRAQAERAAAWLAERPIAAVYSSPLRRAVETAASIARRRNLAVQRVDAITEVDVGDWEGRAWDEIARSDPDAYQRFLAAPERHGYRGGENLSQVDQRAVPALQRLLEENLGRWIVVVGHNVVNRVFLARLIQLPLAAARLLVQDNCGVNLIRHRGGETQLRTLNSIGHLESVKPPGGSV